MGLRATVGERHKLLLRLLRVWHQNWIESSELNRWNAWYFVEALSKCNIVMVRVLLSYHSKLWGNKEKIQKRQKDSAGSKAASYTHQSWTPDFYIAAVVDEEPQRVCVAAAGSHFEWGAMHLPIIYKMNFRLLKHTIIMCITSSRSTIWDRNWFLDSQELLHFKIFGGQSARKRGRSPTMLGAFTEAPAVIKISTAL